uniref:Uncharacterized protein n=1 Tax=Vespula pensylvanica TaxID=30213 RepID=A0A834NZD7_VESPE|nr:hypothetical protein H0235_009865 [Vespula pensylvanica]
MTSHGDFSTANSLFRATEKVEFHSDLIQSNDLGITQNQIRSIMLQRVQVLASDVVHEIRAKKKNKRRTLSYASLEARRMQGSATNVAVEVVKRPRPKPTVGNISITVEVNDFQEIDRELSHEDDDDDDDGGDPRCILATTNRQNILMVLGYDLEASTPTKGNDYRNIQHPSPRGSLAPVEDNSGPLWWFSRCAGQCGGRIQPFDKKHDHCRKIMLSIILIGVATIILFGVVCAFVTNEYMEIGTAELPNNVKTNLKDVMLYLATTKREINTVLKTNYGELEITLNNILQASGRIVTEQLAEYSHAVSLTNLNDIVIGLESIREELRSMNRITQELRLNATQLDIVVRGVKNNLLYTLRDCTSHNCKQILHDYKVNQMSVQIEFDKYMDRYFPKLAIIELDNMENIRDLRCTESNRLVMRFSFVRFTFYAACNDQ